MQHTGDDFGEKLEKTAGAVTKQVAQIAVNLINDVKQLPPKEQEQVKNDDQKNLAAIRQNIRKIDQEFMQAYKKRHEKAKEAVQAQQAQKQQKTEEKKKRKEAMWQKQIKAQQGSKEQAQRASG